MSKKPTLKDATESLRKIAEDAVEKKMKVKMVSYSIKMVIPTGAYANIQPEIVVKAGTVEEAHDYIAPHLNKLWKEYFMCSERRPEPVITHVNPNCKDPKTCEPHGENGPVTTVAFTKASQAITSCLSLEALELISKQIGASVKLTPADKEVLVKQVATKFIELNQK